ATNSATPSTTKYSSPRHSCEVLIKVCAGVLSHGGRVAYGLAVLGIAADRSLAAAHRSLRQPGAGCAGRGRQPGCRLARAEPVAHATRTDHLWRRRGAGTDPAVGVGGAGLAQCVDAVAHLTEPAY